MIILITGVSASWKSTLQQRLVDSWEYKKPINFTTRQPRSEAEKDDYVFIDKNIFLKKLANWDFFEHTISSISELVIFSISLFPI